MSRRSHRKRPQASSSPPSRVIIKPPLVDVTSLYGVQSLFHLAPRDPFAPRLVADFTDLFVFYDHARYPVVYDSDHPAAEYVRLPQVIEELNRRDSGTLIEEETPRRNEQINGRYLGPSLAAFAEYARNNRNTIRQFMALHNDPTVRIRPTYQPGLNTGFVFDVQELVGTPEFRQLVAILALSADEVCHVFDMVLKYSLYGRLAGRNTYYLAHPLRVAQNLPTYEREVAPPPPIPFRLGPSIASMAESMSLDDYTALLHEARGLAREMHIAELKPDTIERDTLREFAARLQLPPRLKHARPILGVSAGVATAVTGMGLSTKLGSIGGALALAGSAISVASVFWKHALPRSTSRIRWLHWALEWDIEKYALP